MSAAFQAHIERELSIPVKFIYLFISMTVIFARIEQNQSSMKNVCSTNELKCVAYSSAQLFEEVCRIILINIC